MAKVVRQPLLTIYSTISKYKLVIFSVIAAAVILAALGVNIKAIVLIPPMFIVASISSMYRRMLHVPPALELISLTTVAVGVSYGGLAGAIFGAAAALAAEIISGGIDAFVIGYVIARAVMGLLAGVFSALLPEVGIVAFGLALTAVFNLLAQALYLMQGDPEAKMKTVAFVSMNMLLNWIIFALLGNPLTALMD